MAATTEKPNFSILKMKNKIKNQKSKFLNAVFEVCYLKTDRTSWTLGTIVDDRGRIVDDRAVVIHWYSLYPSYCPILFLITGYKKERKEREVERCCLQ